MQKWYLSKCKQLEGPQLQVKGAQPADGPFEKVPNEVAIDAGQIIENDKNWNDSIPREGCLKG